MAHLLQRALIPVVDGRGAAEDQHRASRHIGIGDAGDAIGDARPGGQQRHAGRASHLRPALGGMHCDLLVARIHHADALAHTAVVDGGEMTAAEREDDLDSLALEHLRDQQPAVQHHLVHPFRLAFYAVFCPLYVLVASIPRLDGRGHGV